MAQLYLIPNWFFGYDIVLELIFAVIALFVAFYSFKIYKLSEQRELKLFSLGFLLISLSYFAWSAINFFLVDKLNDSIRVIYLGKVGLFSVITIYSHILLFMAGLATLFYMTTKVQSPRTYTLLLTISLLGILFAYNKTLIVYILSSIYLLFILVYYAFEYYRNNNNNTRMFLISFILLFVANCDFAFNNSSYTHYVFLHLTELVAFLLILWSLLSVVKHGKKKK